VKLTVIKCIVFRDMLQMSHDHSMFFIIICLHIITQLQWERFRQACGLFRTKNKLWIFHRKYVYFLEHWAAVQELKWIAPSSLVGCFASPQNSGDFVRKKSPTSGEIRELWNGQLAKSPFQPGFPPWGSRWQVHNMY